MKIEKILPFCIWNVLSFPAKEELHNNADGVWQNFGVEFVEDLAFTLVVSFPRLCLTFLQTLLGQISSEYVQLEGLPRWSPHKGRENIHDSNG